MDVKEVHIPCISSACSLCFIQASSSAALADKNNNEYELSVLPTKL